MSAADTPASPAATTWRVVVRDAVTRLDAAGCPHPELDARRLVERAGAFEVGEYGLVLDDAPTRRAMGFFDAMLARRLDGEPLQYVVGAWSFRTLDVLVDPRVLIPRPETEVVVDHALAEVDRLRGSRPTGTLTAVDLGTGSGVIAMSLVAERDGIEVWATDLSAAALEVARANLAGLGRPAARVRVVEGRWFEALDPALAGRVDLVVGNPPYIADGTVLDPQVAGWEPSSALFAGPRGTDALETIIDGSPRWLAADGALVLELSPEQGDAMVERARRAGFADARIEPDLSGRARVLVARVSS